VAKNPTDQNKNNNTTNYFMPVQFYGVELGRHNSNCLLVVILADSPQKLIQA
jgi:hypothetical protein